jgi:signal transduction histidine kinase
VKRIVQAHRGRISVRSRPGEETTFEVRLKAIDAPAVPSVEAKSTLVG